MAPRLLHTQGIDTSIAPMGTLFERNRCGKKTHEKNTSVYFFPKISLFYRFQHVFDFLDAGEAFRKLPAGGKLHFD